MATLVRRTWAQIRDEVITSAGGYDYTGFSSRVEQIVYSAYLELSLGWFHHELETSSTPAVSTGNTTINTPADCFILMGVYQPSTDTLGKQLDSKSFSALAGQFSATQAAPQYYCRFKDKILLNCPCNAATAGNWTLRYYTIPAAPDFAGGASPTTAWLWDEILIQGALAKVQGRVWRPDLGAMGLQTMQQWLAEQVQPNLAQNKIIELPDIPTASRPVSGAQG